MSQSPTTSVPETGERILFVTGRLAESVTRQVVESVSRQLGFSADVCVVGISVAALMHVDWLLRKLDQQPHGYDRVFVPGWCQGDLSRLTEKYQVPFALGPKEILDLTEFFGQQAKPKPELNTYDIKIIAEINHAPRMSDHDIFQLAEHYRCSGADLIDIGCIPGESWSRIATVVRQLHQAGYRISIDSFDRREVESAIEAGAELVLSCNSTNVDWLSKVGSEVVVIPDDPAEIETMWQTCERLDDAHCPYRIDPILEPIGFGFAASLERYYSARKRNPQVPMMMGIGNLTEMTEVDSVGVNAILAAICQELEIHSVLTTEVIPWCRSAVKEFDLARKLMQYAVQRRALPKRVTAELILLKTSKMHELGESTLVRLSQEIRDANYRIFVERGEIHVMNRNGYWRGKDPFEIFDQFIQYDPQMDVSHAFYLGYELAKAVTALTVGKQYRQDQALAWGFLTVPEPETHDRRRIEKVNARQGGKHAES